MKNRINIIMLLVIAFVSTTLAQNNKVPAKGFAVFANNSKFTEYEFNRHPIGDDEIFICRYLS